LFGLGDELNEDAMLGRLEGMKDVIEQVNRQFKDPVRLPTLYGSRIAF
jgi:arsenite/tail-anchored protein-transporting ATPase